MRVTKSIKCKCDGDCCTLTLTHTHTHTRTLTHTHIKHTQIHRQWHIHSIGPVGLWALWACSDNIVVQLSTQQTHTPYASKQI